MIVVLRPNFHVRKHGLCCKHVPHAEQKEDTEDGKQPTALFVDVVPCCCRATSIRLLRDRVSVGRGKAGEVATSKGVGLFRTEDTL